MFAGAVRETVFSRPEVIRRVNAAFVPVAIRPPALLQSGDEEGRLFQSIYGSRPADQGICVANRGGQALDWVLMFDDEKAILAFLDHSLARFRAHPDATQPLLTERYMRFPSARAGDHEVAPRSAPIPTRHPAGTRCPAAPPQPPGTLVAQVFGRALDPDGKPTAQTVRQERYAQDRFDVTPDLQEALAKVIAAAGTGRVRLPTELARRCVMHAYLGQIDVRPLSNPLGGTSDLKQCEFWAQRVRRGNRSTLMRVVGLSEVVSELKRREDAPSYRHEIKLTWVGFIEITGARVTRLLLSGRGREKLQWGTPGFRTAANSAHEVAYLPAGRPIDTAVEVRYGILGRQMQKE